ncbi:hypothetical protein ELI_3269 [Eubacterium callanderi]|uniref:Uncharacterized protein n=1 Tax=Eubacterium callanderi TaxID=53442 RepID=E3GF99_9FIRM|nr:hypothetical protein ELI_3269 [Eubacterium callanderi]
MLCSTFPFVLFIDAAWFKLYNKDKEINTMLFTTEANNHEKRIP